MVKNTAMKLNQNSGYRNLFTENLVRKEKVVRDE